VRRTSARASRTSFEGALKKFIADKLAFVSTSHTSVNPDRDREP